MQMPDWQLSMSVQRLPSSQLEPLATLVNDDVDTAGWQLWQELAGLTAPEAQVWPPITHCARQLPPEQASPAPHVVPSGRAEQVPVSPTSAHD